MHSQVTATQNKEECYAFWLSGGFSGPHERTLENLFGDGWLSTAVEVDLWCQGRAG